MSDYQAICEALYRFAAGQDDRDAVLFRSAFTPSARVDFSQPAATLGVDLAPFEGLAAIETAILGATAPLITTHTITNVRLLTNDNGIAHAAALIEAQHIRRDEPAQRLLLKNRIEARLEQDGPIWRIATLLFSNFWREGDPDVLFG